MKIKNIIIAVSLLFSLSNCSDYLVEKNKTDVLKDELYRTPDGYESLVKTAYATLRNLYQEPWMYMAGTDMYVEGRNSQPDGLSKYKNLSSSDVPIEHFYRVAYEGIQRCNLALYYNDLNAKSDKTEIRKGEVKFLRAYYYFMLVQSFGGVSLVTETFETPVVSFERKTAEEIYSFIIAELNEAVTLLEPATSQEWGRATARAVKHYLAKVHLTRGYETFAGSDDFAKAASYADDAINGQALSTISYENLFWPGKEKNAEVLFSIQYDKTSLSSTDKGGSTQNAFFGPYLGGEGSKLGYPYRTYTLLPTKYVYDLFTKNDARWEGSFMNVFYERYYDFYDKAKADRPKLNVKVYYPQKWESDATSIANWRAVDPVHRTNTKVIPYTETAGLLNWETVVSADEGTPPLKKFDDPISVPAAITAAVSPTSTGLSPVTPLPIGSGGGNSTRDIFLARLGETYLIAAEAYIKLGNTATALLKVNEVRKRAEKTPGSLVVADANLMTIDFILDERALELMGEYHRWFDLKRTGKLKERVLLYNKDVRKQVDPFLGIDGNDKILRPIPQKAIDLNSNKNFPQNPGY